LEIKKIEGNIGQINETIRKIQANSAMVKKNNEYQAMLHEIEQHKLAISNFESKEIELLDILELQKKSYRDAEKDSKERIKNNIDNQAELKQLITEVCEEINTLNSSREEKSSIVPAELLSHYNRLVKSKGTPLVAVNNGTCGNCHLKLTPQTLAESKKGATAICDNCQHLLYFAETQNI
jgi:predicted  nucleic acid-binding Zn-ribbon protein